MKNNIYHKKCCICKIEFVTNKKNKENCSFKCRQEHVRRNGIRSERIKRKTAPKLPCEICGYSETVDRHREGDEIVILCPNHHCLITRGIKSLKELREGVDK